MNLRVPVIVQITAPHLRIMSLEVRLLLDIQGGRKTGSEFAVTFLTRLEIIH
jgi:hypothetical protein